jgi:glycosyltransferase involved in cell wall biosynthesis
MLRDIVRHWASEGASVDVLSTQPSYQQKSSTPRSSGDVIDDRVRVRRIALPLERGRRWLIPFNIVIFSAIVAAQVLMRRRRYDVVMTSTAPPVVLAWVASRAAHLRGSKFIYHCMDIHPEIGRLSGDFRSPLLFRALQLLDQSTCATAAAVVVLSNDMAATLRGRQTFRSVAIRKINNFDLGTAAHAARELSEPGNDVLRIVFTGNIGRFQGLDTVVAALSKVKRGSVHLTLMGDGTAVQQLREQASVVPGACVSFIPHQDVAAARALMASSDLGLVSLTQGIHHLAYPSKTMTYLAEGCPVLAIVELDCELVQMLEVEGVGLGVSPGDVDQLARVLDNLAGTPQALRTMREKARLRGPFLFEKGETLDKWSLLLQDVVSGVDI